MLNAENTLSSGVEGKMKRILLGQFLKIWRRVHEEAGKTGLSWTVRVSLESPEACANEMQAPHSVPGNRMPWWLR